MRTDKLLNLVHEQVNKIITKDIENFKEFREIEKTAIIAKLITITTTTKRNLNQEQALQVIYKQLGVSIWLNIIQYMKHYLLKMKLT